MKGETRKVGKENTPVWSTRLNKGKGDQVFMNEDKAVELMKQGHLVLRRCRVCDL